MDALTEGQHGVDAWEPGSTRSAEQVHDCSGYWLMACAATIATMAGNSRKSWFRPLLLLFHVEC